MARPGLYLDDRQIADELGIKVEEWRANAKVLTRQGMPAPDALFGRRYYWPAVKAFLDRRAGLDAPSERLRKPREENFNVEPRRRSRTEKAEAH